MSSPPAPTKPPRGVKQGKETSGLLMSVIRTLSASETNEQREKERAKLEKEYKKSDARLDELVADHAPEIMEVMKKYSSTSAALSAWGQRCDAAVARLAACQQLLRLRHDDLRRLWSDARTTHYALQMLTDIERVVVSERETRAARTRGASGGGGGVLRAAHTLRDAQLAADTSLKHVTALEHTREHLQVQKRSLVDEIVSELNRAVYRSDPAPLSRNPSARRRTALLLAELTKSEEVTDAYLQDITPEFEASLSEEDKTFETTVMISLEALGVLEQLKEATEKFKVQIQSELLDIIATTSRRIADEGDPETAEAECERDGDMHPELATETGRPFARLLASLNEELFGCAERNKRLLQLWRAALQRHNVPDSCLHTEQHYWSSVQQVMQLLLTEYLDISSVSGANARVADSAPDLKLADYFNKKRVPRRTATLFTYQPLPAAGTVGAAGAGTMGAVGGRGVRGRAVCAPSPALLHVALPALHDLVLRIEASAGGGECSLRAFITNYVREGEAQRLGEEARQAVERALADASGQNYRSEMNRRILTYCAKSWSAVAEACAGARRCAPLAGPRAARAPLPALRALHAHCRALSAASAAAPPAATPAKRRLEPRAERWLADDDIVRFLQSLPNWRAAISTEPATEDKNHDEELKQAYEREAEILGSSLGDGVITSREIIDVNRLAEVALFCESMAWLSGNVKSIPGLLSAGKLPDKLLTEIASIAADFDDIQHKCLLLLHLELRIQCFYYLGQEAMESSNNESGGAAKLAQALLAFHELAGPVLHHNRMQYIMCGLGEMMSSAIVGCGRCGTGAGALAALRHCLAALRLPAAGLARAQAYTALLQRAPQEIIQTIRDKGAEFSELEYLNAFKIIGEKRGISQSDMKGHLQQLSSALGHVGVTV